MGWAPPGFPRLESGPEAVERKELQLEQPAARVLALVADYAEKARHQCGPLLATLARDSETLREYSNPECFADAGFLRR